MHRWFAVEANNRAWELAEQEKRDPAEDRAMLNAAHCAAQHWSEVGTPLHDARATTLLAEVYAQLGQGDLALRYARPCFAFFQSHDGPGWDRALATLVLAGACGAAGRCDEAAEMLDEAGQLGAELENAEERDLYRTCHARTTARIAMQCTLP